MTMVMGQDLAVESAQMSSMTGAGPHAERLSKLVTTQRATVDRDTGLELYRDMTLGRRFEDKCAEMYYRGKMFGFVHLYNGQDAVSSGVIGAMKRQHDWLCSTQRSGSSTGASVLPARSRRVVRSATGGSWTQRFMHPSPKSTTSLVVSASLPKASPWSFGFHRRYKRDALGDASSDAVTAAFSAMEPATTVSFSNA